MAHAKALIASRHYVVRSRWSDVQPSTNDENDYLETHSWFEYGSWHLAINDRARLIAALQALAKSDFQAAQQNMHLSLQRIPSRPKGGLLLTR